MTEEAGKRKASIEFDRWLIQTRRGALTLAVLAAILDGESYGYNIMKRLNREEYDNLQVEPSTIYPLLRRLEQRGMLEAEWSEAEGKRKRLYFLTKQGKEMLRKMSKTWLDLTDQLARLLKEADLI
ncbi:MAG: helix-turn-helix transcriptional regulator [Candidatus Thorarchaeota archaeon]|nr:helix-turn-helix transcriptional regulator [Candidatus Thorarchaeota archaeon]